jgi:hypothetical protein
MLELSNEKGDLSTGTLGFPQGEGSNCRQEVAEVASNPWHKTGDVEEVYSKLLDIGERRKLMQDPTIE